MADIESQQVNHRDLPGKSCSRSVLPQQQNHVLHDARVSPYCHVHFFSPVLIDLCVMLFRSRLPANSKANGTIYHRTSESVTALCKVQCKICITSIMVWGTTKTRLV